VTEGGRAYLCIGVGGMGMAPLAGFLARSGAAVAGFDDRLRRASRAMLEAAGVDVRDIVLGEEVAAFDRVVYSSAVPGDHPLMRAAEAAGVPRWKRGEMLAEIASGKRLLAVAGSHGKTSTAAMVAHVLEDAGVAANVILGGFRQGGAPAFRVADAPWLVAEIDESDGTIEAFRPEIALLLNMDWDHADRYRTEAAGREAFLGLARRTTRAVLAPADGGDVEALASCGGAEVLTFGRKGDFRALAEGAAWRLSGAFREQRVAPPTLPEGFVAQNGLAALAGASFLTERFGPGGLRDFAGMRRRQAVLAEDADVAVVEDYAHHPTEIADFFAWLRQRFPGRRTVVAYQPHRYTRTRQFKRAFAEALGAADELFLLPVYGAHEAEVEGGRTEDLRACFAASPPETITLDRDGARRLREACARADGAVVMAFVGAGDIDGLAALFAAIRESGGEDAETALPAFLRDRLSGACRFAVNEPLARKTTLRVGGPARFYAEPADLTDLRELLDAARLFETPWFCLGRGSNLLVADEGFDGLVLRFHGQVWRRARPFEGGRMWAASGARLKEICGAAAKAGMRGFEFLEGIPGTLGGGLRMNAGAMGRWMFDLVERVQFLDAGGRYRDIPGEAFHFGYREVRELAEGIALGAVLRGAGAGEEAAIRERARLFADRRQSTQPRDPSAGCIFKNPEGSHAGQIIDELGLKGARCGGAEISEVHGNFIVNRGGATARDVFGLIDRVRREVARRRGCELEPEVLLLGRTWPEALEIGAAEGRSPDGSEVARRE